MLAGWQANSPAARSMNKLIWGHGHAGHTFRQSRDLILLSLCTESVVNNAASLTSDDEDEGADDEDSVEGSADQMLVF